MSSLSKPITYYKQKFENLENNAKLTWKMIDEVLGRNSDNRRISQNIDRSNNTITSSKSIFFFIFLYSVLIECRADFWTVLTQTVVTVRASAPNVLI